MQIECKLEQALARKYPDAVALAIAKDSRGRFNPIALGWLMFTSGKPATPAAGAALGADNSYRSLGLRLDRKWTAFQARMETSASQIS